MKVVQIIPNFSLAGAEIMCENLIYSLRERGVDVVAISMFDLQTAITERLESKGVKIIYLGKKMGLDLSMFKKFYKVLKEENPDVIHTHINTAQYAVPAALRLKIKCKVHTVHNIAKKENGKLTRLLSKRWFKRRKVVPVALSSIVQDSIVEEYNLKREKVPIIFNGIDLSKCKQKKDYSIGDVFKILHIGRFYEQKNHKGLIEAFALFHKKYPNSELQLIGDRGNREEIEAFVREKGLTQSIKFLGEQKNVYGYLQEADLFALPSLYEGVPMTLIEAMGTGLPIVATRVGGIPDMLTDGESAILTEVDVERVAQAFAAFAEDEEKRRTFGLHAKEESLKFSAKTMTEKYLAVYKEWM